MIGAVMLLMAATVGITYGWTPDGGDGVKYIIQIPPEKIDQVVRSGEISSNVPAEIRGHVSEVVIRVGQGNLPRVTPRNLSSRTAPGEQPSISSRGGIAVAAADQMPVPIPSMGDPTELRPIGIGNAASTAMMKPAPQSGGMNMPSAFPATPTTTPGVSSYATTPPASTGYNSLSLEQAARDAADNAAKQYNAATEAGRQQIQQNVNAVTGRLSDAANAQFQSATTGIQNATNDLLYGPGLPSSTADDPRTRLSQSGSAAGPAVTGSPMSGGSAANGPSTSPYTGNTDSRTGMASASSTSGSASSSTYGSPPNFANSAPSTFGSSTTAPTAFGPSSSTSMRTGAMSPSSGANHDEEWFALQSGAGTRPSTAPVGSSSSSFTSGNFGQLPAGLPPAANPPSTRSTPSNYASSGYADDPRKSAAGNGDFGYDPNLSPAQAAQLPKNGYSFDAQGYPVDRQGYRVDRYGRRVDSQGHLLTAVDSMGGTDINAGGSSNNSSSYANNRPQQNSSPPPLVQAPRNRPTTPERDTDGYLPDPDSRYAGLNGRAGNDTSASWSDERPRAVQDSPSSALVGQSRRDRLDDKEPIRAGGYSDLESGPEQVAAQPIFNALLLLSVVANVYLLFWLKNMREQFRDMVATKRGAASGGSLATGI